MDSHHSILMHTVTYSSISCLIFEWSKVLTWHLSACSDVCILTGNANSDVCRQVCCFNLGHQQSFVEVKQGRLLPGIDDQSHSQLSNFLPTKTLTRVRTHSNSLHHSMNNTSFKYITVLYCDWLQYKYFLKPFLLPETQEHTQVHTHTGI